MKIVKSFGDIEFFNSRYESSDDTENKDFWHWGLGEDGRIYFQNSEDSSPYKWYPLKKNGSTCVVDIRTMKKIVEEFGHLLVWI